MSQQISLKCKQNKYAVFGTQHKCNQIPNELTLSIANLKLTRLCDHQAEDSVNFLGIRMDENLTWRNYAVNVGQVGKINICIK